MSNVTDSDSNKKPIGSTMGDTDKNVEPGRENSQVEANTQKPKRKYTRRKQPEQQQHTEVSGERHNPALQRQRKKGESGSTIEQARKQRKRKQDLADEFGLVTDGFSNARSKVRSRKSGKNELGRICREEAKNSLNEENDEEEEEEEPIDLEIEDDDDESDSDEESDEEEAEYARILAGMFPFMRQSPTPAPDTVLDKVVTAFTGYPVCTHVAQIGPKNNKLVIEIDI